MDLDRQRLHAFLAEQDGVIHRQQAELCGMTRSGMRVRLSRHEWFEILPGVYRSALVPMSMSALVRAGSLWAGGGALLIGAAAAWWWGMTDIEPRTATFAVPYRRHLRSRPGVAVVRRAIPAEDRATHRMIRVAAPPYAALFGAVELGRTGQQMLDRALLRCIDIEALRASLSRNTGCQGAAQARRWLESAADGCAVESERLFLDLMRKAGITGWQVNRRRRIGNVPVQPDFLLMRARLVVEVDGWAFHSDPETFDNDRRRQNQLVTDGWKVLRFTWTQLQNQPEWVVAQVLGLIPTESWP